MTTNMAFEVSRPTKAYLFAAPLITLISIALTAVVNFAPGNQVPLFTITQVEEAGPKVFIGLSGLCARLSTEQPILCTHVPLFGSLDPLALGALFPANATDLHALLALPQLTLHGRLLADISTQHILCFLAVATLSIFLCLFALVAHHVLRRPAQMRAGVEWFGMELSALGPRATGEQVRQLRIKRAEKIWWRRVDVFWWQRGGVVLLLCAYLVDGVLWVILYPEVLDTIAVLSDASKFPDASPSPRLVASVGNAFQVALASHVLLALPLIAEGARMVRSILRKRDDSEPPIV